jgi:methylenetetrahydrofolate reductase (NADPH)
MMGTKKSVSNLERVLRSGAFAVTAELGPPRDANAEFVRKKARILKGYADAVNITDNQTAIVRMSSLAASAIALSEGLEPVLQMTCRDRNRLAMESEILGAAAMGANNVLCLTGDHQSFGDHPQAKGVWDLDAMQMILMVKSMRDEKKLLGGFEMEVPPQMFIGAAENPFADPFEFRAHRLKKKIDAGAQFIQTQIVYNLDKFERWMKEVREMGLHERAYILAGIAPLKSSRMAKFMQKNVPGLDVPEWYVERMAQAEQAGRDPKEEGKQIAIDLINIMRDVPGIAGVHLMAIGWEDAVPDIVTAANLYPRP